MARGIGKIGTSAQIKAEDYYQQAMAAVEKRCISGDEEADKLIKRIRDVVHSNREGEKWGRIFNMSTALKWSVEEAKTDDDFHTALRRAATSESWALD